jgi:hypothetical protein
MDTLDGCYRAFYAKTGTESMYFWSERSSINDYKQISVAAMYERLMPMKLGKNPQLDTAKWAARGALLLSKTDAVPVPAAVAWGK